MKDLNIMTVCGFGIGSSLILKMTVDTVLRKRNLSPWPLVLPVLQTRV